MRVKRASLAGILGIVFLAGILRPAVSGVFDPETFILENGLQVVVISDHRAPVVNHMIWYKVGAADEAPGKSGRASTCPLARRRCLRAPNRWQRCGLARCYL